MLKTTDNVPSTPTHTNTRTNEQEDQDGDGHHEGSVAIVSDDLDNARLEDVIPPAGSNAEA